MIAHLISLTKTVVNFCKWTMDSKIPGGVLVLFSSRISFTRHIVILLVFLHLLLFYVGIISIFCGWLLNFSRWFYMVVGGCRSFLLLVTTQSEVNNCAKVTLDGR